MALSSDLISQFVKTTNDTTKKRSETMVHGTIVVETLDDGTTKNYVKIDGSSELTPITSTVDISNDDRVTVLIKNHTAIVTGNLTAPAAKVTHVEIVEEQVSKKVTADQVDAKLADFDKVYAKQAVVNNLSVEVARVEKLTTDKATIAQLNAATGRINTLETENLSVKGRLNTNEGNIKNLQADVVDINEKLSAPDAEFENLSSDFANFKVTTTDKFKAIDGSISDLNTKKLDAESAKVTYANIDFSNISEAAIREIFSETGFIKDLTVGDGTITGKLVGVTISGDLIEGNTVKAEKLVVKGSDGLYYKLNVEAGATTSEKVTESDLQNGLHGSAIIAKTITAEKISVSDLVAFGATIGGFKITENSIYSGVKSSVDNTTQGIYLDAKDGQMAVGDTSNFIKYYKDTDGTYKLKISANSVILSSSNKSVETAIADVQKEVNTAQSTADEANDKAVNAETLIAQLADSISMLVTDGNGTSLMTQTENGWTFSTAEIQSLVDTISEGLNSLTNDVSDTNSAVDILQQAVNDLGEIAEYVKITTFEDEPCIELGEGDSDFKLRITNTRMMFTEGSVVLAYFTNQSFNSKKIVVEEELQQGGFIWKIRSNGNLALIWEGDE